VPFPLLLLEIIAEGKVVKEVVKEVQAAEAVVKAVEVAVVKAAEVVVVNNVIIKLFFLNYL
jgi:hypothetical protein